MCLKMHISAEQMHLYPCIYIYIFVHIIYLPCNYNFKDITSGNVNNVCRRNQASFPRLSEHLGPSSSKTNSMFFFLLLFFLLLFSLWIVFFHWCSSFEWCSFDCCASFEQCSSSNWCSPFDFWTILSFWITLIQMLLFLMILLFRMLFLSWTSSEWCSFECFSGFAWGPFLE